MRANSNTKKVRIALVGTSGKMGKTLIDLIKADSEVEYVGVQCDVVIDFSAPEGTKKAIAMKKPLVCGTTGLSEEIFSKMRALSKKVPVLYCSNFSLGMTLCFEMLKQMSTQFKKSFKIEIEELHHAQKKDAPSGTALKMAELLGVDRSIITTQRMGNGIGTHQVNFILNDEKVTLKHEALSRTAFAQGALTAAKFIFNKPAKLYSLSDIFY